MGLDAQVIAIGPFNADIASALEYGEKRYAGVPPGATVVSTVFLAATSDESVALAAAFGVGAFEMGKHKLDPKNADIEALALQFGEADAGNFRRLASRGFEFYYMPNG
ncbi:hypothetical protein LRH25_31505 [Ideonella azotifigens]|uniref:Uncharacterized protein n=1 Tax=Ideonella azotifigens TaxID=513160 RepID=A0ABN1K072_9BURK|nr:hypothetical protein [Ideonella azotifigens]MCD2344852.1 hypothetical protein [Ideonella azotifigens]